MRLFRIATFAAAAIWWLLASAAAPGAVGAEADNTSNFSGEIVLGATFPLSGPMEMYGQSAYFGANTCVKLINANGGVNGKKLVLEWRDNRSDPIQAVRDVEDLVRELRVPAVLGPLLSESTMAVRQVAEQSRVVVMTPLATTDAATRDNPWMFRACFTNSAEAEALVRFQMENYGAKSCGILYDSRYAFSNEMATIFAALFAQKGGTVAGMYSFRKVDGSKDYAATLELVARSNPDFIFIPSYALEATEIVQSARELNIPIRLCGTHTWDIELVFDASGSRLANSAFASTLFEKAFSYKPFQAFFTALEQAGMDNPDAQAASAYDAVLLLAQALKTGETPDAVRKGLLAIKNMPLATGRTTILPNGETRKPVLIRVVERQGGRLVPVYAARYDP